MLAMLAGTTACDNGKQQALWNEIKQNPTSTAIFQYIKEYPEGEFIDSVNTYYKPYVAQIDSLKHASNPEAFAQFQDEVKAPALKEWVGHKLDSVLTLEIKNEPTLENLTMYVERFPNAPATAEYQKQLDELKAKVEAERKAKQTKINSLLDQLDRRVSSEISDFQEISPAGTIWREYMYVANRGLEQLKAGLNALKEDMTS